MPGKHLNEAQRNLLNSVSAQNETRLRALAKAESDLLGVTESENLELSRVMSAAVRGGVPKTYVARALGIENFYVLRNLYALTERG